MPAYRHPLIRIASPLVVIFLFLFPGLPVRSAGMQSAVFINVGQGDAALLRDGEGFDVLIDGGRPSAGDDLLAFLRAHGVTQLDAMVATHADADHIGGLIDVLEADDITVSAVYYNGYPGSTATWSNFEAAVAADGLTLTPLQFPQELDWGAMRVYVLNPPAGLTNPETNDASIVLRVDIGPEINYLFTGDIDTEIEAEILARGTPVAAEVLKVAHHGSAYGSSEVFLAAVSPEEAVISVGANSYGHPAPETLSRLQDAGANIWRTDQHMHIFVESDGLLCWVQGKLACGAAAAGVIYLPIIRRDLPPTPLPSPTVPAPPAVTVTATFLPTAQPTVGATGIPTPVPTATATASPTVPAGTGQVEIIHIHWDGVGNSEPDEYVEIRNTGGSPVQLAGWTLSDAANHVFTFPLFVMAPGQTCRVYTNEVHPEYCGFSYGSGTAIWNNSGDTATLRDNQGKVVDTYSY